MAVQLSTPRMTPCLRGQISTVAMALLSLLPIRAADATVGVSGTGQARPDTLTVQARAFIGLGWYEGRWTTHGTWRYDPAPTATIRLRLLPVRTRRIPLRAGAIIGFEGAFTRPDVYLWYQAVFSRGESGGYHAERLEGAYLRLPVFYVGPVFAVGPPDGRADLAIAGLLNRTFWDMSTPAQIHNRWSWGLQVTLRVGALWIGFSHQRHRGVTFWGDRDQYTTEVLARSEWYAVGLSF